MDKWVGTGKQNEYESLGGVNLIIFKDHFGRWTFRSKYRVRFDAELFFGKSVFVWKRLDDVKRHIRTLNSGTLFALTAEHCGKFCIGLFKMQGGEPMKIDGPELIEEFLNIKERS